MGSQFTRKNSDIYGRNVKSERVKIRNPVCQTAVFYDNRIRVESIPLPNPGAAGADIATTTVWTAPEDCVIRSLKFHQLRAAVADPGANPNDMVVTVANATGPATVVTKTFVAAVDSTPASLGTLSNTAFLKGDRLTIDITQTGGGTSNIKETLLTVEWSPAAEDQSGVVLFKATRACTIKRLSIVPVSGKIEAAAATNDLVIAVKNGATTLVTKTLTADVTVGTWTNLGALTGSPALAADDTLTVDFTINGTAYLPACIIIVEYYSDAKTFAGRNIFRAAEKCTIEAIRYDGLGASAGVDDSNTVVIAVKNSTDTTTLVTATYDTSPQPPAANTPTSLGTLSNTGMDAGDELTLDETLGITAELPDHDIIIDYVLQDADP